MRQATPTIVVGSDGSPAAGRAADAAAAIARSAGDARLVLVGVGAATPPAGVPAPGGAADDERILAGLEGERDRLGLPGVEVRPEAGDPVRRLLAVAAEEDARLLVVGTRGQGAVRAALLGSVVTELMMHAPLPVLAVPAGFDDRPPQSVVCGIVDTAEATLAATAAERLATLAGARLVLVSVIREGADPGRAETVLREVADALDSRVGVDLVVRHGSAADQLAIVAGAYGTPLIALGSRGLGPARSVLLGSTSRAVLHTGRFALLTTPPPAVDRVLAERTPG
jgi:nucleotide-binding universal stress UspA family protein